MTKSQKLFTRMINETSGLPDDFDGDYKDVAAIDYWKTSDWWCLLKESLGYEIPEDFQKDMEKMPDGFLCPRSYGDWGVMMCEKYGQKEADPTPASR